MKIDTVPTEGFHTPQFQEGGCVHCKKTAQPAASPTILQRIAKVASIVFKAIISFFLYWINPSLFSLGFILGIVADDQCKKGIEKIHNVWKSQPWSVCILGVAACILSLPVTLGTSSCLWGAYLGSTISRQAQKIIARKAQEATG